MDGKLAEAEKYVETLRSRNEHYKKALKDRESADDFRSQALQEKLYREVERKYMRDLADALQIDIPHKLIEYDGFIELAKHKVKRLKTKIEMLLA